MTVQPTRDQRAMWRQIATDAGDDPYVNTLHPDEVLALLDQLDQAEARIKAVEDVLDKHETIFGADTLVPADRIRRALDS